eukprot:1277681-Pleurochrysis_carterae.AAC.2
MSRARCRKIFSSLCRRSRPLRARRWDCRSMTTKTTEMAHNMRRNRADGLKQKARCGRGGWREAALDDAEGPEWEREAAHA